MGTNDIVYRITDTEGPRSQDVRYRSKVYTSAMVFRALSFPAAVLSNGILRWFFLASAILLPYVSVIFANAGKEKT